MNLKTILFLLALFYILVFVCLTQSQGATVAKPQQGYKPPFVVDDERQNLNNLDFGRVFMLKELSVTTQKPGGEIGENTIAIQKDAAGNVFLWFRYEDTKMYGVYMTTVNPTLLWTNYTLYDIHYPTTAYTIGVVSDTIKAIRQ